MTLDRNVLRKCRSGYSCGSDFGGICAIIVDFLKLVIVLYHVQIFKHRTLLSQAAISYKAINSML